MSGQAKKKFYAVRRGLQPGIFVEWEHCKASVEGFPGAEYRGFSTLEEAREYLGDPEAPLADGGTAFPEGGGDGADCGTTSRPEAGSIRKKREADAVLADASFDCPPEGRLLTYVDGSYHDGQKKYSFGCVFVLPDGRVYTAFGSGDNEQSLKHRNVTGEMLGAMYAVRVAMVSGYREIEVCYDYEGIEKWVTGVWRSKTELTAKYAASMREWGRSIRIYFTKVAAHTGVALNELADGMARRGLTEGHGVPGIRVVTELEPYPGGADGQAFSG